MRRARVDGQPHQRAVGALRVARRHRHDLARAERQMQMLIGADLFLVGAIGREGLRVGHAVRHLGLDHARRDHHDRHAVRGKAVRGKIAAPARDHGLAHLYRAILETLTLESARCVAAMRAQGVAAARARRCGCACADAPGLPVARSALVEASALGAGMSAAVGAEEAAISRKPPPP